MSPDKNWISETSENVDDLKHNLFFGIHPEIFVASAEPLALADYIRKAGRSSEEVKHYIQWLKVIIQRSLRGIKTLWAAYKPEYDKPVFVAMLDEPMNDLPTHLMNFEIIQRVKGQVSDEAKFVLSLEKERNLTFTAEEQSLISKCLAKHSTNLMRDHSNLTIVSASKVKSAEHARKYVTYKEKLCIVLYVDVKGLVPVHEELLPTQLDGIPVDVREGTFKTYGKKPTDYHEKLMMGCQIVTDYKTCGTLGGFLLMENNRLACLTCCHVFVTEESLSDRARDPITFTSIKKDVYQPCPVDPLDRHKIGQLVKWGHSTGNENDIGIDAALIEISNHHRLPQSGDFPDAESPSAGNILLLFFLSLSE